MKKIATLTLLYFLTFNLFPTKLEASGTIINGKKTKGFKPVVKLNISWVTKVGATQSLCTGTLIGKGTLLTAAHCVDPTSKASLKDIKNGNIGFSITLDREKVPRKILSLKISPQYFEATKAASKGSNKKSYQKYDIAILKITPLPHDEYFPVSHHPLKELDDVVLVGYGAHIDPTNLRNMNYELATIDLESRLLIRKSQTASTIGQRYYDFQFKNLQKKFDKTLKKLLKSSDGEKRYGYNTIESIGDGYYQVKGPKNNDHDVEKKVATVSLGDSGGPLLKKTRDGYEVVGVASTSYTPEKNYLWGAIQLYSETTESQYADLSTSFAQGFFYSARFL